jgi:hypothetical protein
VKSLTGATIALMLLLSSPGTLAQTRSRRTPKKPPSSTSQLEATKTNVVRLQLANLNKDLTRFLYVYGRLSKDLELTGAQTESAEAADKTRAGLIENLKVMSNRLDQFESQFRFTPGLSRQYRSLQGVSARAAQAQSAASAGNFDQAGRILVEVAAQLTDVLMEM